MTIVGGSTDHEPVRPSPGAGRWPTNRALSWGELEVVVAIAIDSKRAVGLEITIFNPTLDRDGSIAHALVTSVARGLAGSRHRLRPCP